MTSTTGAPAPHRPGAPRPLLAARAANRPTAAGDRPTTADRPASARRAGADRGRGRAGGRLLLARVDEDQAALLRARELLATGEALRASDPRAAYESIHRAALRGAGVLVTRANRSRRRKLPLNVWNALERIGGPARERSAELAPFVLERARLDLDPDALPDPELLERHREATAAHLEQVGREILSDLETPVAPLAG